MSRIQDAIRKGIVDPAMREQQRMVKAVVLSYNHEHHLVNIQFMNPTSYGPTTALNVALHTTGGGIHVAGPEQGDEVWIEFINGDVSMPRVISYVDERYADKTRERLSHKRKGAYIPDFLSEG